MPEFVRHDLQHVVKVLRRFDPGTALAGPPRAYVLDGQSLVAEPAVARNGAPGVSVELPFSARRVAIRSHARLFGLNGDETTTVKVALRQASPGESFFREGRARRLVARALAGTGLAVPAVVRADPARGWLVEEFVPGQPAGDDDVARLVGSLRPLYAPTVRFRRLVGSPHSRWLFEQLCGMLSRLAPALAAPPGEAVWPVAFCHGDLGAHNLIRGDDGRLWIIDWEKARFNPVAVELGRLYLEYPHLKDALLRLIGSLSPADAALPPLRQLAFGSAFALKRRQFNRRMMVNERMSLRRHTRAEAEADFGSRLAAARAAIAALAD